MKQSTYLCLQEQKLKEGSSLKMLICKIIQRTSLATIAMYPRVDLKAFGYKYSSVLDIFSRR